MAFVSFTAGVLGNIRTTPVLEHIPPSNVDGIEQRCARIASEMKCPCHHKNACVFVDYGYLDCVEIEIVSCCDRFADSVRVALQKTMALTPIDGVNLGPVNPSLNGSIGLQ